MTHDVTTPATSGEQEQEGKRMFVALSSYLDCLRQQEEIKPFAERRQVPGISDLAAAIRSRHPDSKLHNVTLYNFANGHVKLVNLETAQMIMDELWHMGFKPDISDLIRYQPPSE